MQYLIVGLGNIGAEYQHTRHNIGFDVVDNLAQDAGVRFSDQRYGAIGEMKLKGQVLTLLKPSTYMNLSGSAVRYWMQQKKVPLENVLVIVDDLALPFGSLRLRPEGSNAGHNGLKHIQETLGTTQYARLRFGIGNDYPKGHQIGYVLGGWSPEQLETLPERI
ncbi:MAG: aminoacyl-tRNA hydrolase, partial [Bacteroidales bacterium]|nr:aminoacyl-tRNA hydrolase [Bacteroidales bacterium]